MKTFSFKSLSQRIWIRCRQTQGWTLVVLFPRQTWAVYTRHIFLLIPCFVSVVPHAILFSSLCLFVLIHWPPTQWLSTALGKIYSSDTWCCCLFIVPIFSFIHQVWVVCSSPFPCEIDGSFSFRHSTCGMTEVTLEVLQGQSAIKIYLFQYWYKMPVWVFTA